MASIDWHRISNQSLAVAVRNSGFDLSIFDQYDEHIRDQIRKNSISEALRILEEAFFEQTGGQLNKIDRAIYVICVSNPFTIQYDLKTSSIIYIGRGNVINRLKSHFKKSLFDFMESLSGTNFDFYISEPRRRNSPDYYKHIEFILLKTFSENIGGGKRKFPILNSNAGSDQGIQKLYKGWNKPLKLAGKRPRWILKATKFSDFASLD